MRSRVLVALRISAPPERVFTAFTDEIDRWWQPNGLFQFSETRVGRLAFEPGVGGCLTETYDDGEVFQIGSVRVWEPPARIVVTWRQASFTTDQETELHVRFDPVGGGTRVTVEHFGWDSLPQDHAARHGFPLFAFQQRYAEWWRTLLEAMREHTGGGPAPPPHPTADAPPR
jgi:uncharacterized protein YndB with AHSA1/START domain